MEVNASLNTRSYSQVCTYWYPLSDCWKNRGDGWHHWNGRSARHVYDYSDNRPHDTRHDRSTDIVLRHHTEEPLHLHHGVAAGPHHGSWYLFQVSPTMSSCRNQEYFTLISLFPYFCNLPAQPLFRLPSNALRRTTKLTNVWLDSCCLLEPRSTWMEQRCMKPWQPSLSPKLTTWKWTLGRS